MTPTNGLYRPICLASWPVRPRASWALQPFDRWHMCAFLEDAVAFVVQSWPLQAAFAGLYSPAPLF